ncbi:MAG: hypothetical protein AB1405_02560 [Bdellovibrionota bacterium]
MDEHEKTGREGSEEKDERQARSFSSRLDSLVPDSMKRAFYTGLGALFLTEDGIRRQISDLKLPKDLAGYIISQSSKSKEELFEAIAREIAKMFQDVQPEEVVRTAIAGMKMKMNIEIEFEPMGETESAAPRTRVKFRTQSKASEK